jgi:hypothetical protein
MYDKDVMTDGVPVGPNVKEPLTKVPMAELELEKLPVPVGETTADELLNGYKTELS